MVCPLWLSDGPLKKKRCSDGVTRDSIQLPATTPEIVDPLTKPTAFGIQVVAVMVEIAALNLRLELLKLNKTVRQKAAIPGDRSASDKSP